MKQIISRYLTDKSGATAIEYGLIAGLISVAIITAVIPDYFTTVALGKILIIPLLSAMIVVASEKGAGKAGEVRVPFLAAAGIKGIAS
jgi:Flp pilus assembly pilin Flp